MNRKNILEFVNNLLSLQVWEDVSKVIYLDKNNNFVSNDFFSLANYFDSIEDYLENKKSMQDSLLWLILEGYDDLNIYGDWLPDRILDLSIPQVYLFLKEIKNILESNIPDEQIDEELMKKYNEIKG